MMHRDEATGATIVVLGRTYDSLATEANLELHRQLALLAAEAEPPLLVLDMERTEIFGSNFLEVLVRNWKTLSHRGGKLALCGLSPLCAEVLRQTNLLDLWPSYASVPEAIAGLVKKG